MTSRERLSQALHHQQPDRVPIDFGATAVTGMHVTALTRLRQAVLGDADWRVKVSDPYQMLGEMDEALRQALGIDVVGLVPRNTMFGYPNEGPWRKLTLFNTEMLVPEGFQTTRDTNGDLLVYPGGDLSVPPSGRMPKSGYFFDTIVRQPPVDDDCLNPEDNCEEFQLLTAENLAWYQQQMDALEKLDAGVILVMPGAAFGDIALVPAPFLKHPKGIRDIEEWYVSTAVRKEYVHAVFERQCEVALKNLEALAGVLGDRVDAVFISGTDFGTQRGLFISKESYREMFKPYHQRVNDLVHRLTGWKTFIHSCGGVRELLPDIIEAGFDILNPVQCSAFGMDPRELKREFGSQLTFWGGGVDTQRTLPFGTPDEVYREVRERIDIFNEGGGFVFNAIHNVQGNTPVENLRAMFRALKESF
jgi:uroporphyrinogen-III decarboxylase